ncbi:nucleotide exchange factor GrpE [bacterium]|nr:MAG: nucleotide exchange factor GrpE [bacterium]
MQQKDKSPLKKTKTDQSREDGHEAANGPRTANESVEKPSEVTITLEEYEDLKATIEELKDAHLRVAADFDNYRKRMEKERDSIICFANESLISDLLPILDNLDRALDADHDGSHSGDILKGVRMISDQLHRVLQQCGLEPVSSIGKPFDPSIHEAVGVFPSADHDEGTVVNELQKGYRLKGKVVRPSMVHVAGESRENSENGDED